jgi:DNA modification methylase
MVIDQELSDRFALYHGDCVEVAQQIPSDSVHFSVSSLPFASLYTYSNSERDMGNCRTYDEFVKHFMYQVNEWHRIMMPGRIVAIHCFQIPSMKQRDGFIGIQDFRGDIIRWFQSAGFIYHSEVCIWKDPVVQMQRTKALGLLHKQIKKDSAMSRQGLADYMVMFRKHGDNPEPVSHTNESFPVQTWQKYASPVWMDINPSKTLQKQSAREDKDERHICPLQLEVIERTIELWSNPNDIVYDPYGGIGSSGFVAIQKGRRTLMSELKESYFRQMVLNCQSANTGTLPLFECQDTE